MIIRHTVYLPQKAFLFGVCLFSLLVCFSFANNCLINIFNGKWKIIYESMEMLRCSQDLKYILLIPEKVL